MFRIKTEKITLKFESVKVNSLRPHEEIIENAVKKLQLQFKNWVKLQNTIIVDNNNIVLDGNHRAFVFNTLKFIYISVCKINYFNKNIKLKYWFRLFKNIIIYSYSFYYYIYRSFQPHTNGCILCYNDDENHTKPF